MDQNNLINFLELVGVKLSYFKAEGVESTDILTNKVFETAYEYRKQHNKWSVFSKVYNSTKDNINIVELFVIFKDAPKQDVSPVLEQQNNLPVAD